MVATVTRLKAAAMTVHYFEADGYYARNDPEHRKASCWHGEAAEMLGLHGPVKPNRFEDVLAGYVPGTDLRLGRLRDGEHQHRPGVDVTFSAPKSVPLEALVYAPGRTGARVVRAHDEAVRATLGFIETELLQTRSYEPETGRRPRVQADGMVAATFRHLASRNLDPQLHTHAVIANMTRGRDGNWRSAEFTSVERSKLLIGAYYRNELRTRLEKIGYATVPTLVGRMPGFEIAGFHHDVYGVRAKAGDACGVLEAQDDGRVVLAHPDGRERRIDPAGYIRYRLELYETRPIVLRAGDQVRWTRNDAARGLINGERAEVLSVGPVNVRIETQDGREISMRHDDPLLHHLDHAWSSTVHAAQGLTCDRVIAVLDTDRGAPADQAMFYVELTRARDNVVLLTDDREALIEALETSPAEELSALRAIGEQFGALEEIAQQHTLTQRAAVLDDATRERHRAAERLVAQTLSAGMALIRERDEHDREAHSHDVHVTLAPGYAEWREGAVRSLADCSRILDDHETFSRHLDRRPGAADEIRRISAQFQSDLNADDAEIERRRQQQERQQKQEQWKQEQQEQEEHQEQEHRKQSHRKRITRGRGGLSM